MNVGRALSMSFLFVLAWPHALAQSRAEDEREIMRVMARLGRPDAVILDVRLSESMIRATFERGGDLFLTRAVPRTVSFACLGDTLDASRRSQREAPRVSFEQAEERAWELLPEGATRSEWRVTKSSGFEAGTGERSGSYYFEIERLYYGIRGVGDRIEVRLDAYDRKVLSLRETTGIEPDGPAERVIPVEQAQAIAIRALDRIEDVRAREQMKGDWTARPPTASQLYMRVGGLPGGPHSDPIIRSWPQKMRLRWCFNGPGGQVDIDAETGAVLAVGVLMSAGYERKARPVLSPSPPVEDSEKATKVPAEYYWLWGLAAIPLAAGAWWFAVHRRAT